MKVHAILFSGPMAKALIEGRKTETRRLASNVNAARIEAGALLWVRESFRLEMNFDGMAPSILLATSYTEMPVWYEADVGCPDPKLTRSPWGHPWGRLRPGIHMPKWASRLTLSVCEIKRQRLCDLTDADVRAEGLITRRGDSPRDHYRMLWDKLNPLPRNQWAANPEIIVLRFSASKRNINQIVRPAARERSAA